MSPNIVIQSDQLMTSFSLAQNGLGAAFVTDTLLGSVADGETVCFYRLGSELSERTLYIAYKKQRYITSAVRAFIEVAQEVFAQGNKEN